MANVIETEPCELLFDYNDPKKEQVDIRDIARALSNSCRFGGLTSGFYSVAEHACLVYRLVRAQDCPPEVCLAALHHDSHEAYLGDVPTPLKKKLGDDWKEMEWCVDVAIEMALDIRLMQSHPVIKAADRRALLIEAAVLKGSCGVGPQWNNDEAAYVPHGAVQCLPPGLAEDRFLMYHTEAKAACA